MNIVASPADVMPALRRLIAAKEAPRRDEAQPSIQLGHAEIDEALNGGLDRGKLHEIFAADTGDASSAAGFASMLALCMTQNGGSIVWLRQDGSQKRTGSLYAPGLIDLGLDPSRFVLGLMPDVSALLRAAAEVLRCAEVSVAVVELWRMPRRLDLTASRRLAMAAESSGATALMLRAEAEPTASAAQTRWSVTSLAAAPIEANAPGWPALDIHLLRQRGGRSGLRWQVEWDRERGIFTKAALPGALVSDAAGRSAEAASWRRAG